MTMFRNIHYHSFDDKDRAHAKTNKDISPQMVCGKSNGRKCLTFFLYYIPQHRKNKYDWLKNKFISPFWKLKKISIERPKQQLPCPKLKNPFSTFVFNFLHSITSG